MSTTLPRCRAKGGRATCKDHGTPVPSVSAEGMFQSFMNSQPGAVAPGSAKSRINRAASSNLEYTGKKPEWWSKFREKAMNHEVFPVEPQLLDVIDSPVGELAVVWQDQTHKDAEVSLAYSNAMNVRVCEYRSVDTGEVVGYVKATNMDEAAIARSFGDDEFAMFRWAEQNAGGDAYKFDFENYEDTSEYPAPGYSGLTGEALLQKRRDTWVVAQQLEGEPFTDNEGQTVQPWHIAAKHLPDDDTVKKDLAKFSKVYEAKMKEKVQHFSTPFIDFSRVNDSLQGKGFGAALYVYTSQSLAKKNQVLRGAVSQTDQAQALWKRFREQLPDNVSSIKLTYRGQTQKHPTLDFRK
jgi:hypothetical protein